MVCIRSDFDRGGRNSIEVQQSLRIDLREDGFWRAVFWGDGTEGFQEAFSFESLGSLLRAVWFLVASSERSGCIERFWRSKPSIAPLVFDQTKQASNCLFGSIEISDSVRLEYFDPCLHRQTTHPSCDQPFRGGDRDLRDLLGRLRRVGHRLWRENGKDRIDVRIGQDNPQCVGKPFWSRIADHIDGVTFGPVGWKAFIELCDRRRIELGKASVVFEQSIAGHDPWPTRIGNDGDAFADGIRSRQRRLREEFSALDHGIHVINADDSALLHDGLVDLVESSERTGVGSGGLGRGCESPCFVCDKWLAQAKSFCGLNKRFGFSDRFDVQNRRGGFGIVGKIFQKVGKADVDLVAQ